MIREYLKLSTFFFLQKGLWHNAFYMLCPLPWIAGQKILVLQVLLVNDRVRKVPLVADPVFFLHFQGVENVDLRPGHINLVRQRRHEIGIELVLAALPQGAKLCTNACDIQSRIIDKVHSAMV